MFKTLGTEVGCIYDSGLLFITIYSHTYRANVVFSIVMEVFEELASFLGVFHDFFRCFFPCGLLRDVAAPTV